MPLHTLTLARFRRSWSAVLSGGLLGSAGRIAVGYLLPVTPGRLPVATLTVNLAGSLMLGFYLARREQAITTPLSIQFWGIGVLGSLTTFSAFGIEVVELLDRGQSAIAAGYLTASIVGGLLVALVGQRLGSVIK